MSYGVSAALQAGVYQALISDSDLAALVGTAIYDAIPSGSLPATYVALGPENVLDSSDKSGGGALHLFQRLGGDGLVRAFRRPRMWRGG
jgi:hypothetical protein